MHKLMSCVYRRHGSQKVGRLFIYLVMSCLSREETRANVGVLQCLCGVDSTELGIMGMILHKWLICNYVMVVNWLL